MLLRVKRKEEEALKHLKAKQSALDSCGGSLVDALK